MSVGAAAAVVMGAHELADSKNNFAGGDSYAWDYQPGNHSWVCRNKRNGQYSNYSNCSGPKIDNWQWIIINQKCNNSLAFQTLRKSN